VQIKFREVKPAGEHEDFGAKRSDPAIVTRIEFGALEQIIQGFDKAIGLACLCPIDSTFNVTADQVDHVLHGRDFGTHGFRAPLHWHQAHDVELLVVENLALLFPVNPGARRALGGQLGRHGIT
jgi:hypothetical protein